MVIFINNTGAQNYFDIYKKYKLQKKNKLQIKGDSLIQLSTKKNKFHEAAKIAHDLSIYFYGKDISKSIQYCNIEIENLEKLEEIDKKEYENALYNMGFFYKRNNEYNKCIKYSKKVLELGIDRAKFAGAYSLIGASHREQGDYNKAILFLTKGVEEFSKLPFSQTVLNQYVNLSVAYRMIGDKESLKKGVDVLESAKKMIEQHASVHFDRNGIENNLATIYHEKSMYNFDKALQLYKKILNRAKLSQDSSMISITYSNLIHLYNLEKKDSAFFFVDKAIKYANYTEVKARIHDNLADYQIRKGKFEEALKSIHISLEIMTYSEINVIPTNFQISKSLLLDYTLYCVKKKAEIYLRLYQRDLDKKYLESALKNIERSDYVVSLLLNNTIEESTQIIWRREASQAYLYGAYASHLLGDVNKAFYFMEKNKALLLSEGVLKNTEFANLPRHISDEETRRKKQMYRLESLVSKEEGNTMLQDSLFDAKLSHEKYVDSLKIIYPKYFARKINVEQVPLKEVQKELGRKDAVVSFIWNDFDRENEMIIGLIATKNDQMTFEIKNVKKLKTQLKEYRKRVSQPFETKLDQENYQKVAYELYTS